MEYNVKTLEGKDAGKVALSDEIFGLDPREDILARMVRWQLAKKQQGTHKTKGRAEVSRTGAKMYKQKGTGRARHHSARAPQFRGGGKAHGPVVRSHEHDLPKKVRALALRHALSAKMRAEDIIIVDNLVAAEAKTKALAGSFASLGLTNVLFIGGVEPRQQLQARSPEHPERRCSAGSGHQCLRHPASRQAGAFQGCGGSSRGAFQVTDIRHYDVIVSPRSPKSRRWYPSRTRSSSTLPRLLPSRKSRLPSRRCSA